MLGGEGGRLAGSSSSMAVTAVSAHLMSFAFVPVLEPLGELVKHLLQTIGGLQRKKSTVSHCLHSPCTYLSQQANHGHKGILLFPEAGAPGSHRLHCTCSCCSVSFGLFFKTRFGFWGLFCSRSGSCAPSSSCCCDPGPLQQGRTCLEGLTLCHSAFQGAMCVSTHPACMSSLRSSKSIIKVSKDCCSTARRCWRTARLCDGVADRTDSLVHASRSWQPLRHTSQRVHFELTRNVTSCLSEWNAVRLRFEQQLSGAHDQRLFDGAS